MPRRARPSPPAFRAISWIPSWFSASALVPLLVIGVAITELAVWGRREHITASKRAGYLEGLGAAPGRETPKR